MMERTGMLLKINNLKEKTFSLDERHCFIERDKFLSSIHEPEEKTMAFYAKTLAQLLDTVSTPVDDDDIFVGRAVEGLPLPGMSAPNRLLCSNGHLNYNYEKLLRLGFKGILQEIWLSQKQLGTPEALEYASNAELIITAIKGFADRYAAEAKRCGNQRAYEALCVVPYEPAYDLYSALQAIWLVHLIASCYVGSRDYAFGYMDDYLYPFYLQEKSAGVTDEQIAELFAGFFVKTNEICGLCADNYKLKPILSYSSNQYVLLDGGHANALSEIILLSAQISNMPQPEFTVVLGKSSSAEFTAKAFEAFAVLRDKMHVFNHDLVFDFLKNKGVPKELAKKPAYSACCTLDLDHSSIREEIYFPTVQIFCKVLYENSFSTKAEFLQAFKDALSAEFSKWLAYTRTADEGWWARKAFVLDSLLVADCNQKCCYPPKGLTYRVKNAFLPGLATLGDSLCALDKMVFEGKKFSYDQFVDILKADFVGSEAVLEEVLSLTKFGNDEDADKYTVEMANTLIGAIEGCPTEENEIVVPAFYSLERDNTWANQIPATPDGRRAKTPFSENQSPVYGADKNGITALLNSMAKIPFYKTGAGGLNLTFSAPVQPEILAALVKTYFENGGLHVGISVLDKEVLSDAMKNPEKYKTLTVRLYGFSEYFVSLPPWQQLALMKRTAY